MRHILKRKQGHLDGKISQAMHERNIWDQDFGRRTFKSTIIPHIGMGGVFGSKRVNREYLCTSLYTIV